jgi:dethiobiotin synthetase
VTTYFVTGTDTGVGKTFVSAELLRRARAAGKRAFGFKPVETGCEPGALGSDQRLLCDAAGGWQTGLLTGVYSLREPLAPLVAAQTEGIELDLDLVVSLARETAGAVDFTVVEGAGGWRVPLTATADISTLARRLGAPVVIVARAGLGTINHCLLTIEAVERDDCAIAAVVLSRHPQDDVDVARQNAREISRRWPGRVLIGVDELL